MSIYDPASYPQGVPNPYGPRVHAWKGGPLNEGTRYHGPVYTRPDYRLPWEPRPLWGVGADPEWGTEEEEVLEGKKTSYLTSPIVWLLVGGVIGYAIGKKKG